MIKRRYIIPIFFFAIIALPVAADGQNQSEFNISVADKTEEPALLLQNEWQLETGFLHNSYDDAPASEIAQMFLRHSVSDKIELRMLIEDGKGRDRYISKTVQATYPLAIGAKIKIQENHPQLPDMTVVGYLQLPFTAHNKAQSGYWSPMIFMAFQHQLNDKWSLSYNAGGQQEAFGTSWSGIFNGALHYKITEKLEVFSEYFAQYEPHATPQHNIGGGATWKLSEHFAVYIAAGSSINAEQGNHFYTGGLAIKD